MINLKWKILRYNQKMEDKDKKEAIIGIVAAAASIILAILFLAIYQWFTD